MNEVWIETARGKIYGMQAGREDDPLILGIHGWSQRNGWHTWEPLIEPIAAAGYRVISVDMPGWGKSGKWEKTAGKSAVVAILDALGVQMAKALMGKSWGGGVSVAFAAAYPDRVERLMLTAPAVRGGADLFGRLTQPVLLAWADDDPMIPVANGLELASALSTCTLVRYPTGGHSAAPNNAVDFAEKAKLFLKAKG